MLQFGFFDDRPKLREIMYNFMRLRALGVEVDVKLPSENSRSIRRQIIWKKLSPLIPCLPCGYVTEAKLLRFPLRLMRFDQVLKRVKMTDIINLLLRSKSL